MSNVAVASDLADTMESLQTIAEQCLPETWDAEDQLVVNDNSQAACADINLQQLFKCHLCGEAFKGRKALGGPILPHCSCFAVMAVPYIGRLYRFCR